MRKFFFILLFFFLFISSIKAEYFHIENYKVFVTIKDDSSAFFEENIKVNFHTYRHGIYRYIPLKWYNYRIYPKLLSVKSSINGENFIKEKYKKWENGNWLYIRIGDKNKTIKGIKYYRIIYKIKNAVINNIFYWNIIGTGWKVPIKNSKIAIYFPENIPSDNIKYACFKGIYGKRVKFKCNFEDNILSINNVSLKPHEAITVKVVFPPNFIKPISKFKQFLWWFSENFGFFIPILVFIGVLILWINFGKDESKGSIVVQYTPPKDYTPAEVGTLIDDRVDSKDIVATIVDLAVRGFIKIRKEVEEGIFFTKKNKFIFEKTLKDASKLKNHEKILYSGLFKKGKIVDINDLKKSFYKDAEKFKERLYEYLSNKEHLYTINPQKLRKIFLVSGVLFVWLGIVLNNLLQRSDILAGFAISGFILALFSMIMPQKSHKGTLIYRKILGFKEFLSKVEKDRLKRLAEDDPDIFNKMLPFAIAFGVEKKWAKKFEGISIQPPSWFIGFHSSGHFSTDNFVDTLQSDISSLSTAIGRSSGSSSGGFSGGGAGGGGGGSW